MTNLLNLPQIPAGTTITIASNADWRFSFYVGNPLMPQAPVVVTGTLSTSSETVTPSSMNGIVPGMLVVCYGVPPGTTIASTNVGAGTFTLSNMPTIAQAGATLTLSPPPLDLTGISFSSELRLSATDPTILLAASTTNGLMVNGATAGTYGWVVPADELANWPAVLALTGQLSCVVDIQATASGAIVNLCIENGPIPVMVMLPVTH